MNEQRSTSQDSHKTFLLLSEIEKEESLSQRELAGRLGLAVGLVNSYLKNFVSKGFVRVKAFPRNRYAYLLTPRGFAEKSRLAYQHLSYFTNLYTTTRQDYLKLFRFLQSKGVEEVSFCGVDEVAEIAYLSLKETSLQLSVVMDSDSSSGGELFGMTIVSLDDGIMKTRGPIVLSSLKRGPALMEMLDAYQLDVSIYGPPPYFDCEP